LIWVDLARLLLIALLLEGLLLSGPVHLVGSFKTRAYNFILVSIVVKSLLIFKSPSFLADKAILMVVLKVITIVVHEINLRSLTLAQLLSADV